jgi:flagellar biogenesis protein FliO
LRGLRSRRELQRKQLRLVETLPLGGKRQLMLVTCAGESFLVGGGLDSVETIVRLKADVSPDVAATSLDGSCR